MQVSFQSPFQQPVESKININWTYSAFFYLLQRMIGCSFSACTLQHTTSGMFPHSFILGFPFIFPTFYNHIHKAVRYVLLSLASISQRHYISELSSGSICCYCYAT